MVVTRLRRTAWNRGGSGRRRDSGPIASAIGTPEQKFGACVNQQVGGSYKAARQGGRAPAGAASIRTVLTFPSHNAETKPCMKQPNSTNGVGSAPE